MTVPDLHRSHDDLDVPPDPTSAATEIANLLAVVGRWRQRYDERVTLYENHIASLFERIDALQQEVTNQQAMLHRAAIDKADRDDEIAALQAELRSAGSDEGRPNA